MGRSLQFQVGIINTNVSTTAAAIPFNCAICKYFVDAIGRALIKAPFFNAGFYINLVNGPKEWEQVGAKR
jgi:hypothetical protein